MVKLYCFCIDGIVLHGPMELPPHELLRKGMNNLSERSDEELRKYGWYPWVMPVYPEINTTRFKLKPHRYCNGVYATETFEAVPLDEEEYMATYVNHLKRLFLDTEPWLYNVQVLKF